MSQTDLATSHDRTEWLNWRRTGLGASDVAAVASLPGAYGSPWSVWADKVGLTGDHDDTTDFKFGRYAEAMVAAWFQGELGLTVTGEQARCTNLDEPWILATVDGFVVESANSDQVDALGLLEIKTARDSWADGVPLHYQAQAQWQMLATGLQRVWVAAYHRTMSGDPFTVHVIERDAEDIALLYKKAHTFWHEHVLTGIPPDTDGTDATAFALGAAWPDPADDNVEADDDLVEAVRALRICKTDAKHLDLHIAELENRIKAAIGDRQTLTHGHDTKGRPQIIATWKPQQRSGFDHATAMARYPRALTRFKTTTTNRVLRLKTIKGEN